jgi:hypothetical protein
MPLIASVSIADPTFSQIFKFTASIGIDSATIVSPLASFSTVGKAVGVDADTVKVIRSGVWMGWAREGLTGGNLKYFVEINNDRSLSFHLNASRSQRWHRRDLDRIARSIFPARSNEIVMDRAICNSPVKWYDRV